MIRPSQPPLRLRACSPNRQTCGRAGAASRGLASGVEPSGSRASCASARATAASSDGAVTVSRSSARRVARTSSRSVSTSFSASARAARTASSRSRRARRRSSSAVRRAAAARASAARARSSASLVSPSVSRIRASVSSNARWFSDSRDRASATIAGSRPRRSAIANAWLPPGSPIVSLYVGESVSRSNSTDALRAPPVVWA